MTASLIVRAEAGGKGLSPAIWGTCDKLNIFDGFGVASRIFEDFLNYLTAHSSGWEEYIDTGDTITLLTTEVGGVIQLATDTTDNDEVWLSSGGNVAGMGKVSAGKRFWFEARVRFPQVTNTYNAYVGLSQEGCAAADTVGDTGALADKDLIGFFVTEADGDALTVVHNTASGGGVTTLISSIQALTAATWYKLGMYGDGKKITFYVDGVPNSTTVLYSATNVPDGEELALLFGLKNGEGAAKYLDLDWVAAVFEH